MLIFLLFLGMLVSDAFLIPDPQYYQQFDLNDAIMPHLKGALIHDPRCNIWLAKLVPKR